MEITTDFRQAHRLKPAGNLFSDKMFEKFPVIATRSDWVAFTVMLFVAEMRPGFGHAAWRAAPGETGPFLMHANRSLFGQTKSIRNFPFRRLHFEIISGAASF
jgi:hypothetical protein